MASKNRKNADFSTTTQNKRSGLRMASKNKNKRTLDFNATTQNRSYDKSNKDKNLTQKMFFKKCF